MLSLSVIKDSTQRTVNMCILKAKCRLNHASSERDDSKLRSLDFNVREANVKRYLLG